MMNENVVGLLLPFLGTSLGSACVFFLKKDMRESLQRGLNGFAAGVMVAASVWSLLIPALEESSALGDWSFFPAAFGFWIGVLFLLLLDRVIPHLHPGSGESEGPRNHLRTSTKLFLAVTLHNIPEGVAVGVIYAAHLARPLDISVTAAFALSLGIAIQNFPEGAIISMPLRSGGLGRWRAFCYGVLSGLVEPIAAFVTILAASVIVPVLPYLLSFAAGAMLYVVVEELVPAMAKGSHANVGTLAFAAGFTLMMILDVALG